MTTLIEGIQTNQMLLSLVSGLIGAVVGGLLAAWGSVQAVRASQADIERDEIRRARLSCLIALSGLRFALADGWPRSAEDASRLMFELNRAAVLWSDNTKITNILRDLRDRGSGQSDTIVKLLREMADTTALSISNLADSDIARPFTLTSI